MRHYLLLIVAVISVVFTPVAAQAAYKQLTCANDGGVDSGMLFDAEEGDGNTSGTGDCQFQGIKHIFSNVICRFVLVLNDVMGKVYCGMQFALVDTLRILLTLYIAVFGFQLLVGTAQLNAKDILTRLLKIAAVWIFATESTWGVGVIFNFFMNFMASASTWVVNPIEQANSNLASVPPPVNDGTIMPLFGFLDDLVYGAFSGPLGVANNKVMGFFIAMMLVFPPVSMLGIWWAKTTFFALVRSVVGFLMCLAAVAFLISLSPIFLSLMLFQSTNHFFETWLKYIISYTLQVVLVFGIIVMWTLIITQFTSFFNQLSDLIFQYDQVMIPGGAVYHPADTWAICPPEYGEDDKGPTAVCAADFTIDPTAAGPEFAAQNQAMLIPPSKIETEGKFLYFVIYHMVTLICISYAFTVLLNKAQEIARALSGASAPALLKGGFGNAGFGSLAGKKMPDMIKPVGAVNNLVDRSRGLVERRPDL